MRKKYILRNTSRKDVLLSDLGYRIPAGKAVNLLGIKSMLTEEIIEKSRISGSLSKVINKYLIKVEEIVKAEPPLRVISKFTNVVVFPQKTKSFITIEVMELTDEELRDATSGDEDAFLQQLEGGSTLDDIRLPIVAKKEDESGKSET